MNRNDTFANMRIAGYHSDSAFTRSFTEPRISLRVADTGCRLYVKQKVADVPCHCHQCTCAKL